MTSKEFRSAIRKLNYLSRLMMISRLSERILARKTQLEFLDSYGDCSVLKLNASEAEAMGLEKRK